MSDLATEAPTELALRAGIYQRLLAAQRAAPAVSKDGTTNEQGNFKYVSHENVLNTLVPVLLNEGLVLTRSFVRAEDFETKTAQGKIQWMHSAVYEYVLTDAETGYSVTFQAEGRSMNTDDRGAVHAVANVEKPFLMGLLMVAAEEGNKPAPQEATRSRKTHGPAHHPARPAPPSDPVGVKHDSGPSRIPDAQGKRFTRRFEGEDPLTRTLVGWVQSPEGLELPNCGKHAAGAPMMELPPNGQRYLCVVDDCGEYLDLRDQSGAPAATAAPASPPPAPAMPPERDVIRGEVERLVVQRRLYPWQWEAIQRGNGPRLHDNVAVWSAADWTWIMDQLRRNAAGFLASSIAACAKDTPAAEYRVRHLDGLARSQKIAFAKRAEITEACKTPAWHDAVEALIEEVETGRPQAELKIGQATHG